MTFYKPKQGDTASVVADGYATNFKTLDASKADAQATAEALAGKVDKADGKDLMTASERDKLTGIEAGANAYTLPVATASSLGGVKAGDNVTIADDGTLSATAEPYELPKASSTVLGGVKVGRNLSIDTEGRLSAVGGGSGEGGGILVLPYVAPERDSDGNITNSAAYVDAWGGILSAYLAAPDSHALYMEIDGGDGLMLRMPCNLMNMGGEADAVQWLISGFTVVNVPVSPTDPMPCKAIGMANVVCNAAGEMQSLVMYVSEGIARAGKPNLLDNGMTIFDISQVNTNEEGPLKAALQPIITALIDNPHSTVMMCDNGWAVPMAVTKWMGSGNNTRYIMLATMVGIYGVENDGANLNSMIIDCECTSSGELVKAKYTVTSGDVATKEYVKDYVRQEIPHPRYRNLCLNSRGDNLNCWKSVGGATEIALDTETFGYPVIKTYGSVNYPDHIELGICSDSNCPDIQPMIGLTDAPGLDKDVVISYDYFPTIDCAPALVTGIGTDGGITELSFKSNAKAGVWNRVIHKIPKGSKIHAFQLGLVLNVTDVSACGYIKNIQLEYGTEATPYCYNDALPYSLDEQLVPGEFWPGFDGVPRQVYIRTFQGTTPAVQVFSIMTGIFEANLVSGYIFNVDNYKIPSGLYNGQTGADFWNYAVSPSNSLNIESVGEKLYNKPYRFTFKYTRS